jgi:mono/diheme cytochrome c family protein
MKKLTFIATLFTAVIFASCGGDSGKAAEEQTTETETTTGDPESYDPIRGQGKFTAELLALTDQLDETKAKAGEAVSAVKCTSCHKMTDEKLVGPGWKGVTTRRTPEWIMNFITNPDPMLDKDPEAQAMLELCLVRMPNQNLADEEARNLLEFMRKNDGVK